MTDFIYLLTSEWYRKSRMPYEKWHGQRVYHICSFCESDLFVSQKLTEGLRQMTETIPLSYGSLKTIGHSCMSVSRRSHKRTNTI